MSVRRLDVFGSAAGGTFDAATSDVDILVEFDPVLDVDHFDRYFTLKERLEALFDRPVDLVTAASLRNPYFRQRVMATREPLYAA
ncbi:nucleotidyltransferase domain-containing protein [Mycobacterium sp. M1]|uniref:Nucleotidyltransferase domain-containing protein n=2 Tax=Mycolicibacter acidiphilus TaxID=2835306 RepID=A0ABS5RHX2_9MYCO|nr:nucleotidyltransferase domain-containing protein [Mycolicibacter acidiphilus]